ncbi:MAG TPA: carbon monoxide dehydrogenase [Alphaproteobacteria bacterium]|nr:carbon monoxide dehydrogenase [Alphaproteobacteria bacterium]
MYEFDYHTPQTLADARSLLSGRDDPKLLAGGQTLLPTMKQRLAAPSDLIDLRKIADLAGIACDGDKLRIGAMTRHAAVADSEVVKQAIPALARLAGGIGDPLVRHRGTLGGSIANNDPSADYPAACLGLGATIVTDRREIAADDFFLGMFETALEEDEIITAVAFPVPQKAGYAKFPNPASRYAMVGVFVAQTGGTVRVAVTGAAPGVFRVGEMEAALASDFSAQAIADIAVPSEGLLEDLHGSAAYRANLVTVMAKRAVQSVL